MSKQAFIIGLFIAIIIGSTVGQYLKFRFNPKYQKYAKLTIIMPFVFMILSVAIIVEGYKESGIKSLLYLIVIPFSYSYATGCFISCIRMLHKESKVKFSLRALLPKVDWSTLSHEVAESIHNTHVMA
tara:strand:- start:325 stop:708 length:384 start_codon:yes stop_codon:yes gene_type:complete